MKQLIIISFWRWASTPAVCSLISRRWALRLFTSWFGSFTPWWIWPAQRAWFWRTNWMIFTRLASLSSVTTSAVLSSWTSRVASSSGTSRARSWVASASSPTVIQQRKQQLQSDKKAVNCTRFYSLDVQHIVDFIWIVVLIYCWPINRRTCRDGKIRMLTSWWRRIPCSTIKW